MRYSNLSNIEMTRLDHFKVLIKQVLSLLFEISGGFHWVRWFAKPAVTIVAYHRIIPDDTSGVTPYISVRRTRFLSQLQFFKQHYSVIPLEDAIARLREGRIDRNYLVVTFDDGYMDNRTLGSDLFIAEGISPAIFVTTDCVDQRAMLWPDWVRELVYSSSIARPIRLEIPRLLISANIQSKIAAIKKIIYFLKPKETAFRDQYLYDLEQLLGPKKRQPDLMLDWEATRHLAQHGATIGSHTKTHTILTSLTDQGIRTELLESKKKIEAELGIQVNYFAYPNGSMNDFNSTTEEQLKNVGYQAALTTVRGVNRTPVNLFRLRRTGIYQTDLIRDIKLKLALEQLL